MKVMLWEIKDQTTTVYLSKYPESSNSHHCSYTIQIYFLGRYLPHFGFIILRCLLTFCLFNSQYINNHKFIKILVNCPSKLITFWQLLCSNLSNSTKEKFSTRIYLKKSCDYLSLKIHSLLSFIIHSVLSSWTHRKQWLRIEVMSFKQRHTENMWVVVEHFSPIV